MVTNRDMIARRIAKREICSISEARLQVDIVINTICDALKANETVRLSGLGMFYPKKYEGYVGYNPFNKQKMLVSPYRTITFRIGKDFMRELNKKPKSVSSMVEHETLTLDTNVQLVHALPTADKG